MTRHLVLDEIIDPGDARVLVERDERGRVRSARFALAGLPRVDAMLVGQSAAEVPALVERLCGICPAAHHLAGIRALEAVAGVAPTPTAVAVRRLLHHGSIVAAHAARALATDRDDAFTLLQFGRAATAAAGSPGHFPDTAVPGGVRQAVSPAARDGLAALVPQALAAAGRIAERMLAGAAPLEPFAGADVGLADPSGTPDLFGERLRAVAADGTVLVPAAPPGRWDELIAEAVPGDPAPRPYLVALGERRGHYRVGPVAQLRIGRLGTPVAAELQAAWATARAGAGAARAVVTVHATETIGRLLGGDELVGGPVCAPAGRPVGAGVGVGWVDGPRGLLVHRYATAADGRLTGATLLTPTAQNEVWLAELLRQAAETTPDALEPGLEAAIREADPCLPCSSAPPGAMGVRVETVESEVAGPRPAEGSS